MILNSYAKLNLYLDVVDLRKDNFHNIITLFERISLADKIVLKMRSDSQIKIISTSPDIPKDKTNLAFRSAKLLQESLGIFRGVDIEIIKRIPVGSGLGGGSSNAAFVLLGLNKLWRLNLTASKLVFFAKKIGSDVPFFVYQQPYALARAKGDEVKPLSALKKIKFWHILVVPKIHVSTPMIYKGWDRMNRLKAGLTRPKSNVNILTSALSRKNGLSPGSLFNALEPVTLAVYPELKRIRDKLNLMGVQSILMSGSGPAIFGITSSKKEAASIHEELKKEKSWRIFVVHTC